MRNEAYHLLASYANAPMLLAPGMEAQVTTRIESLVASEDYQLMQTSATASSALAESDDEYWATDEWYSRYRPYIVENGILMIPISGVLLHRFAYAVNGWATGYAYIERALRRGMDDGNVRAVALVLDTPGGHVAGCFELSDLIVSLRDVKPIRAFASDHAFSAGYALASAASQIIISRSGGVGSVGVVTMHVDYSKMVDQMGMKVTFIFAGKHKVDGNVYESLPDSVKARIQERIDRIYGIFVALVAGNRGMEEDAVRATEALTYDSSEAVPIGFADRIGEIEEEMAIFQEEVADMENETMTQKTQTTPTGSTEGTFTQAQLDAAVASAVEAATATATAAGAAAATTRIKAIMECDEAKKRPATATALAFNPKLASLSAEDVAEMMVGMPEEKAEAASTDDAATGNTPFDDTMSKTGNPGVGAETGKGSGTGEATDASAILNDLATATGAKRAKTA